MKVKLLLFSSIQEIAGTAGDDREIPGDGPVTVAEFLEHLYGEWPALREWDGRLLVAVGLEYAGRDSLIHDGDEVAVMPPVQGG